MERKEPTKNPRENRPDTRRDEQNAPDRTVAPIEREHETYAGVIEEDEKRKEREGH